MTTNCSLSIVLGIITLCSLLSCIKSSVVAPQVIHNPPACLPKQVGMYKSPDLLINTTAYTYDADGRILTEVITTGSNAVLYRNSYTDEGILNQTVKKNLVNGTATDSVKTKYVYNKGVLSQVTVSSVVGGKVASYYMDYDYKLSNTVATVIITNFNNGPQRKITLNYNAKGYVVKTISTEGTTAYTSNYTTDTSGRVLSVVQTSSTDTIIRNLHSFEYNTAALEHLRPTRLAALEIAKQGYALEAYGVLNRWDCYLPSSETHNYYKANGDFISKATSSIGNTVLSGSCPGKYNVNSDIENRYVQFIY